MTALGATQPAAKPPTTSAAAVANAFIGYAVNEPNLPPLTQMKLQKLIFYAHAWYLANYGGPLFEDDVEAWPWGPVVRDVYIATAKFGKDPVTEPIEELRTREDDPRRADFVAPKIEDESVRTFVKDVWDIYKTYTAAQLTNSTHAPDEPWTIVKDHYGSLEEKPRIPNKIIEAVFKKKLADAEKDSAA